MEPNDVFKVSPSIAGLGKKVPECEGHTSILVTHTLPIVAQGWLWNFDLHSTLQSLHTQRNTDSFQEKQNLLGSLGYCE